MDTRDALLNRRTVHTYRPEPIPDEAVERALVAATRAPNHRLTFPWRFTRVGHETRATLAELALRLKRKPGLELTTDIEAMIRDKILNPAELIVVSIVRCSDPAIAREDYASAACAIQNLCLSLFADGFGSKWSTGKVTTHPETYEHLGIDPDLDEIIAFVWAGIPADDRKRPARPALSDVVRRLP